MSGEERGQLTLKNVPVGKGEEAIIDYLGKLFKNVSRDKLAASIKKLPLVLSRNVPAKTATNIIAQLEKLGATVVYAPNGSPGSTAQQAKSVPKFTAADLKGPILKAFQGDLPRVPVSALYRLGLCLVAFAMLLLPLVYLGLIGGVCYFLYMHATESVTLFNSLGGRAALFAYIGPLMVGVLLVLFMIKPLFVQRASWFRPSRIARQDEPLLYAFVEKLCKRVGAPLPEEIHLDTNVNASAGFRRGLLSIFGNDLVLTIGLPLAGGMNLTQFAGVLAHEFGHFAQATGMRLTYIIRSINLWFERVVYEEDAWDERMQRWSREWDIRIGIILLVARLFIWLTRKVLWIFMFIGHCISSLMLRQMEYDADTYETHLVGAEVFESTARRMLVLNIAHQGAAQDLGNSWEEGRLVDNLPALILANEKQIPEDYLKRMMRTHFQEAQTGLFDTHPTDRDRIERARSLKARPVFKLDVSNPVIQERIDLARKNDPTDLFDNSPPASILFRDFDGTARRVSLAYYRGVFGKEVMPKNLVSAESMVKSQDEEMEHFKALDRFFQGQFNILRPLGLPAGPLQVLTDPKKTLETIKDSRQIVRTSSAEYSRMLKSFEDMEERIIGAFQIREILDAGFHLSDTDVDAMFATFQEVEEGGRLAVAEKLEPFEQQVRSRLMGCLQLITVPAVAARVEDAEGMQEEAEGLLSAGNKLELLQDSVRDLKIAYHQLGTLVNHLEGNEEDEKLVQRIRQKMAEVRKSLGMLKNRLLETDYPFEHTQTNMTLGEFVIGPIPDEDDLGSLLEVTYTAIDRIFRVYARLAGRLARLAETVEKAVGLPPLPEPEQASQ